MKLGLTYHRAFYFLQARRASEEGLAFWRRAGARIGEGTAMAAWAG